MQNPHLNSNAFDAVTGTYHCAECEQPLESHSVVLKDHAMIEWQHKAVIQYQGRIATDEFGKTIEGVYAVPPRAVQVVLPLQNHLRYCKECFPLKELCCQDAETVQPTESENHTVATVLWKDVSGWNHDLTRYAIHHDCLPGHFNELREFVNTFGVKKGDAE